MSTQVLQRYPTPYPDVNAVVDVVLTGAQTVLGHHFVGMYLLGSLATGDFAPERSDVDFVVVTADDLSDEMTSALRAMHARASSSGLRWASKLEGSYIPQRALRRYDPAHTRYPALRVDGSFAVDHHGIDWVIQRHILREQGIVVAGPAPQTLIDPVQPDDLRWTAAATLREWWAPQVHDPARLRSREYQAYAVLTMCRALYTLRHGTVVTKSVAAQWAQRTLGERWTALIERALAWPQGTQLDDLDKTLDFIRYTLERSEQFQLAADDV